MKTVRLALVGDRSETITAHVAIEKSLAMAGKLVEIDFHWLATPRCETEAFRDVTAIWCAPGSPYDSMEGALRAIRIARENKIRFLGTCGGFQHALIEYARNVIGWRGADHAETNPALEDPLIARLSCSLAEGAGTIRLESGTQLQKVYGTMEVSEKYNCNFGLSPRFEKRLRDGELRFSARDLDGEVRAFELSGHPFFVGTLFQPERWALAGKLHPVVQRFLES